MALFVATKAWECHFQNMSYQLMAGLLTQADWDSKKGGAEGLTWGGLSSSGLSCIFDIGDVTVPVTKQLQETIAY